MFAAVALPEAIEHLMLAGRSRQLSVTLGDLRLALLELARTQPPLCLHTLEERLADLQIGGANRLRIARAGPLLLTRMLQVSISRAQLCHAARAPQDRIRKIALS